MSVLMYMPLRIFELCRRFIVRKVYIIVCLLFYLFKVDSARDVSKKLNV